MSHLAVRLLGRFQVSLDSQPVTGFESNKVRALLAYLVDESDQPHLRQKLADLLWPDLPARRSITNLNQALYNLRKVIGDHQADPAFLLRTQESVQFNPQCDYWLDVAAFQSSLGQTFSWEQPYSALENQDIAGLQAIVDLYHGDFLGGLDFEGGTAFDEWRLVVQQQLQGCMIEYLHQLAEANANQGEITQALSYARRQVEMDPLCEPAHRQLMRLLADSGQRAQALVQFKRLQAVLTEELNIAPEPQTLALRDQIRDQDHLTTPQSQPRDNLPAFLTPLVGRGQEMAELKEVLSQPDCRLLTVLGPGGSGKTRLALELARNMREAFLDGVFFVALNPLQSPDSILPAIAEALDLPRHQSDDQQTLLVNYLQARHLLLVLDGFEHLLAGAQGVANLLQHAADLTILVTSRARLNLKGEHIYPLAGMHFPPEGASSAEIRQSDAVQLLIQALRRTQPGFQPTPDDIVQLRQVCQQVLGMPLGLLLAASWGGALELDEIAEVISQDLDYLAADWAEVPARQRSMRATFDHTWELLTERQQALFRCLSVFRGAFTRRAARAVCQASPHELRQLVDRSLLWHKTPGWYEMHELLRQYGRQHLAQANPLEKRICEQHSRYYLGQLASMQANLKSAGQGATLESIDLEHENYRAAWNWAAETGDAAQLAEALEPLCLYYDLRLRYAEGESACNSAIEGLSNQHSNPVEYLLHVRLLIWCSCFIRLQGRYELASQQRKICQSLLDEASQIGSDIRYEQALLSLERGESRRRKDL
jgi:DNA-binding SARP family transcriptional activator/predicted ATPase